MKKIIILSLFVFLTASITAKASNTIVLKEGGIESISSEVLKQFGYTFYRATEVNWTINNTYQKATFMLNGKVTYSLYDLNNKFLVATQLTDASELPVKVTQDLAKNYADFKVANILKVLERPSDCNMEDDTNSYWIDLTNQDQHLVAVAISNSSINVVKREKVN